jgi:predicted Zn-dependent peptidase
MMKKRRIFLWIAVFTVGLTAFAPAWAAEQPARIERTTVSGMTILLQKTPSELVETTLMLKSGSGLDPVDRRGTAELMNYLVELRLRYGDSRLSNATVETNPDYTLIKIRTTAANAPAALAAVKELLTYPLYSYDVIADLKGFLTSDVKATSALYKSYSDFSQEFYGANHPYNNALHWETIPKISGVDVYQWYRTTYQPGNALLSISGGFKKNLSDVEKFYAGMRTQSVDHRLLVNEVTIPESQQLDRVDPNGRVSSVVVGYPAPRLQDPDFPAFRMLAYYLEEFQHYFEELRVKQGLFYTGQVYYNYQEKPNAPNIAFVALTNPAMLGKVETETVRVAKDLAANGISQEVLAKIIEAIKAENDARAKDGRGLATRNLLSFYLQTQLVYDEKLLPKLEQVTPEDIKRVATKYFQNYIRVAYTPEIMEPNL